MSEWADTTLGSVADILVGFAFKSSQFSDDPMDTRLLRGVNIGQGELTWSRTARWAPTDADKPKYKLAEGDVVLAMDRPWIEAGLKRARVRASDLPALLVQRVARLRGTDAAETSFIHHILASPAFSEYLQVIVTGATVPHISQTQISAYPVRLPSESVQRKICDVLDAIDDLIENNRRRIEVLEEMAQAIYREWFVHFRYPGHEDATFIESPLGPIPEGWDVGELQDYLVLQRGFDLPTKQRKPGATPIVGASGIQGSHSASKVQGPGLCTGRSGTIGQVSYVARDFWPLNTTLWVKEFKVASPLFGYFLLQSLDLKELAGGAAVPSLNRNHIHGLPMVVAPSELVAEWSGNAEKMFQQLELLRAGSNKLASIRDLLLPKLVAGEIDVSELDLDALVEAAS